MSGTAKQAWLWTLLVAVVIVLAAGLRVGRLTGSELWLDEADAALTVMVPADTGEMIQRLRLDYNPPIYYLMLRPWVKLFGPGEFALKMFSVVWGVVLIPVVYAAGREIVNRRAGLVAATVAAVNPLLIYYAQEVRPYSLLATLTAVSTWMLWRVMRDGGTWNALGYGLATLAAVYTHNYGMFLLPAGVVSALVASEPGTRGRNLVRVSIPSVVAGLLWLPWFMWANRQLVDAGGLDWIERWFRPWALLSSLEAFTPGGSYPNHLWHLTSCQPTTVVRVIALGLMAGLMLAALWVSRRDGQTSGRVDRRAVFLVTTTLVPLAIPFVYSFYHPIYLAGRYDQVGVFGFLLLLGLGADKLGERLNGWVCWTATVLLVLFGALALWPFYTAQRNSPIHHMASEVVVSEATPGDAVVFLGLTRAANEYQLRRRGFEGTYVSYPRSAGEHLGWFSYVREAKRGPEKLDADAATVVKELERASTLWMYVSGRDPWKDQSGALTESGRVDGILLERLAGAGWRPMPEKTRDFVTFRLMRWEK